MENIHLRVLSAFVSSALGDTGVPVGLGLPWWGLWDGTWLEKEGITLLWSPRIPPSSPCRNWLRVFKLPIAFSFLNLKKTQGIWLSDCKAWLFYFLSGRSTSDLQTSLTPKLGIKAKPPNQVYLLLLSTPNDTVKDCIGYISRVIAHSADHLLPWPSTGVWPPVPTPRYATALCCIERKVVC